MSLNRGQVVVRRRRKAIALPDNAVYRVHKFASLERCLAQILVQLKDGKRNASGLARRNTATRRIHPLPVHQMLRRNAVETHVSPGYHRRRGRRLGCGDETVVDQRLLKTRPCHRYIEADIVRHHDASR